MSFLKLSNCSHFLSTRKHVLLRLQCKNNVCKTFPFQSRRMDMHQLFNSSPRAQHFSTSASTKPTKPHLTRSLQKWKSRKRKSKAQQKKELEALQREFTGILTKRATQLLQDNAFRNGSCQRVATTHNFTNSTLLLNDKIMESVTAEIRSNSDSISNSKFSDVLSKTLDDHVQKLFSSTSNSPYTDINLPHKLKDYDHQRYKKHVVIGENVKSYLGSKECNLSSSSSSFLKDRPSYLSQFHQTTSSQVFPFSQKEKSLDFISSTSKSCDVTTDDVVSHTGDNADIKDNTYLSMKPKLDSNNNNDINNNYFNTNFDHFLDQFKQQLVLPPNEMNSWEVLQNGDAENSSDSYSTVSRERDKAPNEGDYYYSAQQHDVLVEDSVANKLDNTSLLLNSSKINGDSLSSLPSFDTTSKYKKRERKNVTSFQQLLDKSFIEACCFTGNEMLAIRNIEYLANTNMHEVSSADIFNRLIHSLAKKENLNAIKSMFSLLRHLNVSPTLQTYAGCLECIGRMRQPDSFLCEHIVEDIEKAGLDLAEIPNACSFESDEWDCVLKAIHLVKPDFVPNDPPVIEGYSNSLLLSLECDNLKRLENNQYAIEMDKSELMNNFEKQLDMEKKGVVCVPSVSVLAEKATEDHKLVRFREEVTNSWKKALLESFEEKLSIYEMKAQNNINMTVFPYLKLFPPEVYVDIIFKNMQELLLSSEGYSPTQVMFWATLGRAVNHMYNIESKQAAGMVQKVSRIYHEYTDDYFHPDLTLDNHRKLWTRSMDSHCDTRNMDMSMKKWPRHVTKMVGKFLLDLLMYDLKIDANMFRTKNQKRMVPAFCTIYRPDVSTFTIAEIKVHPVVSRLFKIENMKEFQFEPSIVPMLVPPVPWISQKMGGLLLGSSALVRVGDDLNHIDGLKDIKESQFSSVLDCLNTLSACAWNINQPILDLQIQIFKANGDANLKVSPPASSLPPLPTIKSGMDSQEKGTVYRERIQLQHQKRDMHGLWCSDLYRLSIANKFRDETFWFPHSMDFRGRTYPLPPHFNHLGSDNVRGMLLFAKGKPLGPKGHDWLKIHLINLTGLKKRSSNKERLAYANSVMEYILDSAENPLTGKKWWQSSDEPWQTLACCTELAKIERFEGNKEDYICHFPVHQDGSCNGLQHYAALGRDQAGAESVNLMPFDTPQDVYSDVVELVERERKKDAEEGHELAKTLDGFIKRKVIKQTIMTTVYGVTRFGAKAQIHKQLKDIPDFPQEDAWKASFYLTEKTFSSLREMFTATKDIQDWLTESANLISAFKPVEWVTPLGFPVVQPYFKQSADQSRNRYTCKPNTYKQKNAFPPNYIHSLDSTHMMLTSLYSMRAGITFVSVHDCYWTHACDVPIMNQICREQFVNMHKQPLLEDLSEHLLALVDRASNDPALVEEMKKLDTYRLKALLSDVPKRGLFDLDKVLDSTYFFS